MSSQLNARTVRQQLIRERENLRQARKRDFKENRARFSAATEDAVSRVLMLEELLGEQEPTSAD